MRILGLNAFHGDSSAALLRDGQLVAALEEERLNRIKHWAGLPVAAAASEGVRVYYPRIEFCTDNAAMIAVAGLKRLQAGQHDGLAIEARARWPLESLPGVMAA